MLFPPRITGRRLSDLCHRLAVGLSAGVDVRKVWKRETQSARWRERDQFAAIQSGIEQGKPLADSIHQSGGLFPPLFVEMLEVGERTGQTAEVLDRLSHHYKVRSDLTRSFLGMLAWPILQLAMAISVIGLLIWILGALAAKDLNGKPIDVLGIGLVGFSGMVIYGLIVTAIVALVVILALAIQRGALWVAPLQRLVTRLPGIGPAIQTICLARLSWTLHLLMNVEMDMRQLVPLVLRSTGNDFYIQHTKQVVGDVAAGKPLHLAFANSLAFPPPFLDALAVAEESGQISRSMERLAEQYEAEAEAAMRTISTIVGIAIWIGIAALIVFMIFRLYWLFIMGPINEALEW